MTDRVKLQTVHEIVEEAINEGILEGTQGRSCSAFCFEIEGERHMVVFETDGLQGLYDVLTRIVRPIKKAADKAEPFIGGTYLQVKHSPKMEDCC